MLSEEEKIKILILRYIPKDVISKLLGDNKGETKTDGTKVAEKFIQVWSELHPKFISREEAEKIISRTLSGKRKEFCSGFLFKIMSQGQESLKSYAIKSPCLTKWVTDNRRWIDGLILKAKEEDWRELVEE